MQVVVIVMFWGIAVGFVTAGLFASLYQLVTNNPVSFRMLMTSKMASSVLAVPILLFSGPLVIARHALLGGGNIVSRREWGWLAMAVAIIGCWSFLTGIVILDFLFRVT